MSAHVSESHLPIGEISIDHHLPEVFLDSEVRAYAANSLDAFAVINGSLPLKLQIEEFCFQRPNQICTVDSPNKYLAWAAVDSDITYSVFNLLKKDDFPLVLRSHPLEFGTESPVLQVQNFKQVAEFLDDDSHSNSDIKTQFFGRLDTQKTVVQLLKNPYLQKGLLLCRPTFAYDSSLRSELQLYSPSGPQDITKDWLTFDDAPLALAGLRILPLAEFAREKKTASWCLFCI